MKISLGAPHLFPEAGTVIDIGGQDCKVIRVGGVAKNRGVLSMMEKKLGCSIQIYSEPQIVGALGAALMEKRVRQKNRKSMKRLTSDDPFPIITGFMISDLYAASPIKGREDCAHTWQEVGVFGIKGPF